MKCNDTILGQFWKPKPEVFRDSFVLMGTINKEQTDRLLYLHRRILGEFEHWSHEFSDPSLEDVDSKM